MTMYDTAPNSWNTLERFFRDTFRNVMMLLHAAPYTFVSARILVVLIKLWGFTPSGALGSFFF